MKVKSRRVRRRGRNVIVNAKPAGGERVRRRAKQNSSDDYDDEDEDESNSSSSSGVLPGLSGQYRNLSVAERAAGPANVVGSPSPADRSFVLETEDNRALDSSPEVQRFAHLATDPAYAKFFERYGRATAGLGPRKDLLLISDSWTYTLDNEFASRFFKQLDGSGQTDFPDAASHQLCDACRQDQGKRDIQVSEMRETAGSCALCRLFSQYLERSSQSNRASFSVSRAGSAMKINGRPALRIFRAGPTSSPVSSNVQIGFPALPEPGSVTHLELVRAWLRDCDSNHTEYNCPSRSDTVLPTRLLDVGKAGESPRSLCLRTTEEGEYGKYVTLSHRWGDPAQHPTFCTYGCNLASFSEKIVFDDLPRTFQDAVTVTRALGLRYLWIDSLCIIQPHKGCSSDDQCGQSDDWLSEAPKMGQYYSSAYCTIAATSAQGSAEGFLNPWPNQRLCAKLPNGPEGRGALYACDDIDNFHRDVDEGGLNQRGWVFQERVLSSRTVHFAKTQTYWECGLGVRCETLSRMKNTQASILGDPRFPSLWEDRSHANGIRLFAVLFERYAKLALTFAADKRVAIAAITEQLSRTFGGGEVYGVFRTYPGRGLMWQRAEHAGALKHIDVPADREKVPSWSFMAHEGEITYLDVPFGQIEWNNIPSGLIDGRKVRAGFFDRSNSGVWAVFDKINPPVDDRLLRFVVLGRSAAGSPGEMSAYPLGRRYYVLIVAPVPSAEFVWTYERVGIGSAPEGLVSRGDHSVRVI